MNKNETKNAEEIEFLNKFLKTLVGKSWYLDNSIVAIIKSEAPDFLFKTKNGQILAMEVTQLIVKIKICIFRKTLQELVINHAKK